jgi:hypothetical protein
VLLVVVKSAAAAWVQDGAAPALVSLLLRDSSVLVTCRQRDTEAGGIKRTLVHACTLCFETPTAALLLLTGDSCIECSAPPLAHTQGFSKLLCMPSQRPHCSYLRVEAVL